MSSAENITQSAKHTNADVLSKNGLSFRGRFKKKNPKIFLRFYCAIMFCHRSFFSFRKKAVLRYYGRFWIISYIFFNVAIRKKWFIYSDLTPPPPISPNHFSPVDQNSFLQTVEILMRRLLMSHLIRISLRKHAYSNILKTLQPKKGKFSDKKIWYFSYFC